MANTRFGLGASNVGAVNTGVSAVELGDSKNHTTVFTINTTANTTAPLTVADNAALALGYKLYTFPAGALSIEACHMDIEVNHQDGESAAGAGEIAVGTTLSAGANATIGASASTDEEVCGPLASVDTTDAAVSTVLNGATVISDAATHYLYFNIADTWADVAGTNLRADMVGTITVQWTLLS